MAVEENEELYKKACKEPVFSIIISKIKRPFNSTKIRKRNMTKKEIQTIKHLDKTFEVVGNLNRNDMKAIKEIKKGFIEREREKEREK